MHYGNLPIYRLNFGVITLLPKSKEAFRIQKYISICLLNVSFKVFTKVLTNHLSSVGDHIICPTQTTFMSGRNILEGVVILHETLHELYRRKMSGVILKINFEKTYDKVKYPFLLETLWMKGFPSKWCIWFKSFISEGNVALKVNEEVDYFFQTKKVYTKAIRSIRLCLTLSLIC